ncbi:MAG: glycosyl hydrolase family 18 protein [Bacteroidales bacterium]
MWKKILLPAFLISYSLLVYSQSPDSSRKGIHQVQNEYYDSLKSMLVGNETTDLSYPASLDMSAEKKVNKRVLGWHPYWVSSTAYLSYDYSALTHLAYFSYEVDTATGGYTSIHDWNTTPIISYAHQQGTKVLLTITNFGTSRNTELLTDTVKQHTLLNNIVTLLKARNGDGVNFDLESVSSTQKTNLVSFIRRAVRVIKSQLPQAEISMATPAVDWSGAWDFKTLSQLCDYLVIMGYDYYWKGSTTAGPVAPLEGETYNITRSVTTYLNAGVQASKLMLGVPWYGYDWPVANSSRKAPSTGSATARIFTAAEALATTHGKIFDQTTDVPYVTYNVSTTWRQLWYDDVVSLGLKNSLVVSKGLAGIGIWALSYEGGSKSIWEGIISSFSSFDITTGRIMKTYPNPSAGIFTIDYYLVAEDDITITILGTSGKKMMIAFKGKMSAGFHTRVIDLTTFSPGVYFCSMKGKNLSSISRIVITGN